MKWTNAFVETISSPHSLQSLDWKITTNVQNLLPIFWNNCLHMSMNVNRSHDVIFKRLLSIIKSLDDELRFYVPFNRISVISGQWMGKHERPCAMKRRLASERISPSAGFEPETPWSDFESAKSSAMRSLLVRSRKQENVTLTTMPIIWNGTKAICPAPPPYTHTQPGCRKLKRPMSRILAQLSPAHPSRCVCVGWGWGRRSAVTNDWCITNQAV